MTKVTTKDKMSLVPRRMTIFLTRYRFQSGSTQQSTASAIGLIFSRQRSRFERRETLQCVDFCNSIPKLRIIIALLHIRQSNLTSVATYNTRPTIRYAYSLEFSTASVGFTGGIAIAEPRATNTLVNVFEKL